MTLLHEETPYETFRKQQKAEMEKEMVHFIRNRASCFADTGRKAHKQYNTDNYSIFQPITSLA